MAKRIFLAGSERLKIDPPCTLRWPIRTDDSLRRVREIHFCIIRSRLKFSLNLMSYFEYCICEPYMTLPCPCNHPLTILFWTRGT